MFKEIYSFTVEDVREVQEKTKEKRKNDKGVEEEIEISVEEKDPRDLTKKEKAEIMKETAKSSSNKSRDMKKAFEDVIKPGKEEDEF